MMNHIVFCVDNGWIKQCGVTIKSILFYNPSSEFTFHVLGKEITAENKSLLQKVLNENSKVEFHTVPAGYDTRFVLREGSRLSIETYYRFFVAELLPDDASKALYMDADILCTDKLDALFETDLSECPCGMVLDQTYADIQFYNRLDYDFTERYYNAGVILINLDYWRKNGVAQQLLDYIGNNPDKCLLYDQDAINAVFHGKIKSLDFKYNLQTGFFRVPLWANRQGAIGFDDEKIEKKYWKDIQEDLKHPVLVHFCIHYKPWHKECNVPFAELWRKFYAMQYGIKRIKPRPKTFKEKIKMIVLKTAVKIKMKKVMPHILSYPDSCYELEKEYLEKLAVHQ